MCELKEIATDLKDTTDVLMPNSPYTSEGRTIVIPDTDTPAPQNTNSTQIIQILNETLAALE